MAIRIAVVAALLLAGSTMTMNFNLAGVGAVWALVAAVKLARSWREPSRRASMIASLALLSGSVASCGRHATQLEASFAPTISAIEAFYAENKAYPTDLQALVPKYLPSLPDCSLAGMRKEPFYLSRAWEGSPPSYSLGCSWGMQGHHNFNSLTRTWEDRGG